MVNIDHFNTEKFCVKFISNVTPVHENIWFGTDFSDQSAKCSK